MEYVTPNEAREMRGLRLALTAGVPGPWSEAAKAVFQVKGIPFTPVHQAGGAENDELRAWTGRDNAPIAVYEDEPPRDGWADILALAERIEPAPPLVPDDPADQVRMFGLCHLIASPGGFAWERRLMLFGPMMALGDQAPEPIVRMAGKYGFTPASADRAKTRVTAILAHLSSVLAAQQQAGSSYFVGDGLTAADLYWATFCAMVEPLPEERCPMPAPMRGAYLLDPALRTEGDDILLAHRDRIYRDHLPPLDF